MFSGYEHLIGGLCGGVASTITCHPIDLLKVRYSANEGSAKRPQYNSYMHAVRSIVKSNGIRGLYQGLSPSIIASPVSWGLYFHLYHKVRAQCDVFPAFPLVNNLIAGSVTGAIVLAITNPLWVCKTRLCLEYETSATRKYTGLRDCIRKIYVQEGFYGYYRGFIPGLLGTTNGAIQFALYNYMKDWRCSYLRIPTDSPLDTVDYLYDQHVNYSGVIDCIKKTIKCEGFTGLYKGMSAAVIKQLPNAIVTYVVYEKVRHLLEKSNV
ncbi:mitochondrial carrier protein domain-containing protein [Ditylenchus destructor]|uniref:Mitochondrial carrier protein domain-containing protein n=1 Tax=Ditylenchus destructor TaxID=166010 RepID=A0AAD4R2U5_9BILA|nr:mitochondrial carrier protein domain-containing protein [Ditylenchus destructor]